MPWSVIKATYTMPELKYNDEVATGSVPGAGTFILLNGLQLGTSATTRVGRQIMIKSIHIKFIHAGAQFSGTPTQPSSLVRAMIVYDAQPNGTTALASELLENATTGNQVTSSTALRYSQRFKILYDKRWVVNNMLTASISPTFAEVYDEVYMKVNLKCNYADTNNGNIGLLS